MNEIIERIHWETMVTGDDRRRIIFHYITNSCVPGEKEEVHYLLKLKKKVMRVCDILF